jgi:hypothetical protein
VTENPLPDDTGADFGRLRPFLKPILGEGGHPERGSIFVGFVAVFDFNVFHKWRKMQSLCRFLGVYLLYYHISYINNFIYKKNITCNEISLSVSPFSVSDSQTKDSRFCPIWKTSKSATASTFLLFACFDVS